MKRLVAEEIWRYFKFFVLSIGLFVVSLLMLRDIGYIDESQFLIIMPYLLLIFAAFLVLNIGYDYLVKKKHQKYDFGERQVRRPNPSPLAIVSMVFTSITVLNSSVIVLGYDTPLEGPEAFVQMLLLLVLIGILVGMLLSSYLKNWYQNLERDELFSRFVETGEKQLFRWISILYTSIILGLGLITLILSITLTIETGLSMHETFIKIFGAVVVLALITRFILYRRRMMEEDQGK